MDDQFKDITSLPGFREAVRETVLDLMRFSQSADGLSDILSGEAFVGAQNRPRPSDSKVQFDKTDTRVPQLIRFRKPASGGANTSFDICIPGSSGGGDNTVGQLSFVTQNGLVVPIAPGELACVDNGPWWTIKNVLGTPSAQVTAIWICAVPDQGGTSPGEWPVSPTVDNHVGMKFFGSQPTTISPPVGGAGIGARFGLQWKIAQIDTASVKISGTPTDVNMVPSQIDAGQRAQTATMGDADPDPALTPVVSQSIVTYSGKPGVLQINNWNMTPVDNDPAKPMLVNVGGVAQMMKQQTGGDITPTDPSTAVVTLGPHDAGDAALGDAGATCDGTNGIKISVVTGVVYTPSRDHVLYFYRRDFIFTAKGRLYKVGAETRVDVNSLVEI